MLKNTADYSNPYEPPNTGLAITPSQIRNTAAATAMFFFLSGPGLAAASWPPTYEPGFHDSACQSHLAYEAQKQYSDYRLEQVDHFVLNDFLTRHPVVSTFLEEIKTIINDVYENEVTKSLRYCTDPEGDEPLLEVTLYTGLPIDDFFEKKDKLLFEKIQQADLATAFKYVVLSHG